MHFMADVSLLHKKGQTKMGENWSRQAKQSNWVIFLLKIEWLILCILYRFFNILACFNQLQAMSIFNIFSIIVKLCY